MNLIESHGLSKTLGTFHLQNVTFSVPGGAICGLAGENGAGKSTTIRLLTGALRPDSGSCSILGIQPQDATFLQVKDELGVVLDDTFFPVTMTAAQIGKFFSMSYRSWRQDVYDAYLDRFALPRNKTTLQEYSRGMRMKLGIATALSHEAKVLILDEATAGLDPVVRDEVLELFADFVSDEQHAVLICSHILSDLEKLCDYIAFLHQGKLLFFSEKDALLDQYGLFSGTAEQADSLSPEAVIYRDNRSYGGVRALVKRALAPATLDMARPTLEDIILYTVKGGKQL